MCSYHSTVTNYFHVINIYLTSRTSAESQCNQLTKKRTGEPNDCSHDKVVFLLSADFTEQEYNQLHRYTKNSYTAEYNEILVFKLQSGVSTARKTVLENVVVGMSPNYLCVTKIIYTNSTVGLRSLVLNVVSISYNIIVYNACIRF